MKKVFVMAMCGSFFAVKAVVIVVFMNYVLSFFNKTLVDEAMLPFLYVGFIFTCMLFSFIAKWHYAAVIMMKLLGQRDIEGSEKVRVERLIDSLLYVAHKNELSQLELKDIIILVEDTKECNAWACGDNVIVLSSAALELNNEMLKGLLAHELAHLINGDGKYMVLLAGETLPYLLYLPIFAVHKVAVWVNKLPFILCTLLALVFVMPILAFQFVLAVLDDTFYFILNIARRKNEYAADQTAALLGASKDLKRALMLFAQNEPRKYFWSISQYFSTHPQLHKRIDLL